MDLLELVRRDTGTEFRRAASTNGGEHKGPCPLCGGQDRFCVWPDHPNGKARYWCRQCGTSGDLLQYLRDVHGMSFQEAKKATGLDAGPIAPPKPRPAPKPEPPIQPPPAQWQERARAFVAYAQEQLWSAAGYPAREYLRCERGLGEETIRRWKLGYNPKTVRFRGKELGRWGAETVKEVVSRRRSCLTCAPGIVIPCEIDGYLWRVKVRCPHQKRDGSLDTLSAYLGFAWSWRKYGETKYYRGKYNSVVGGKDSTLFSADALRGDRPLLLCEGEFDAILAWQALRDMVDVATLGGASKGGGDIPARWLLRLLPYKLILVAYDVDRAGDRGAASWLARSRRARRVKVPAGDDLTSFWKARGDLAAWLAFEFARLEVQA